MRILMCADRYYPMVNGVVTSMMTLRRQLIAMGHEVRILTLSSDSASHISDDVVYIGSFDAKAIYPDIRIKHPVSRKYIGGIIDWKPDVIHCNNEFSTFFLAKPISRACRCPMVMTYHTNYEDYLHYVNLDTRFGSAMLKRYLRYVSSRMAYVISPTKKTAKVLADYGVKTEIRIIPTGLELDRFSAAVKKEEMDAIRQRLGLDAHRTTLVYVGRLGKEKNIEEVVDRLCACRQDNFQFVVVGDGPDRQQIMDHVKESGIADRVFFAGMVPQADIVPYYRLADIFVSASTSETQGLTYIEAMAAGLPLLCRKDQCLEGVIEDGSNGFVFSDGEEFGHKLEKLLSSTALREEFGRNARQRVEEKFSARKFADSILSLYEDAVAHWKPRKELPVSRLWHRFIDRLPLV